ncbi:hypothetical protein BDV95DRAFT_610351 [Massariosphaeria phaeospora]|uniref:Mid2 domain-containing protein n=1 Tax=Massariosphaeria phaeospora TaxID=100035 RepID=A0A7C8I111_9PLEO|nr:hypothetical protein BDV95DRAFT_610351 [Massariosphaeria phaeospora]
MFFDGSTVCSDYCGTDTFYTGSTRDSSSILWLGCYEADNEYFYERPLVSPSTSPTSSSFTTSQPSFSELSVTAASRPPPSSVASQTSSSTPTELEKSAPTKQPSKAWIAGVVVGGVALVAIAGLIFYLLRTRKRNKEETMYQVAPQMMQGSPQQPYPESYAGLSPDVTSPIPPYEDNKTIYAHRVSQQGFNANTASWYAPPEGTIRPPSTAQTMASATARPESELPTIHDLPILINPPQPRK